MARKRRAQGEAPAPAAPARGLLRFLFEPIDIASLVVIRIAFGLLMAWEAIRYLVRGLVDATWVQPPVQLSWPGFEWLRPWPGEAMFLHFEILALLGLLMAVGLCYRLAAALFCLGFTYVFLLDQGPYLNHFYLICLYSFLLVLVPAHRALSIDSWLRPRLRSQTAPAWAIWLLRAQMGVVYFYGGIAKLNWDWLQGYPLRIWMPTQQHIPLVGAWYGEVWLAVAMSWAGLLLDLFIVPALLWRRTRPLAFVAALVFHFWNAHQFQIGVFPWLAIAATTAFFEPDWPRRLLGRRSRRAAPPPAAPATWSPGRRAVAGFVGAWLAIQMLVPLRHFLYPGSVHWTEEGHRFAWHMKLRQKLALVRFIVTDPETGRRWRVDPRKELTSKQFRAMAATPLTLHQYAHALADRYTKKGHRRVEVRALSLVSLNGREPEPLVDPELDLAAEPLRVLGHAPWIRPLTRPVGADWTGDGDGSAGEDRERGELD